MHILHQKTTAYMRLRSPFWRQPTNKKLLHSKKQTKKPDEREPPVPGKLHRLYYPSILVYFSFQRGLAFKANLGLLLFISRRLVHYARLRSYVDCFVVSLPYLVHYRLMRSVRRSVSIALFVVRTVNRASWVYPLILHNCSSYLYPLSLLVFYRPLMGY